MKRNQTSLIAFVALTLAALIATLIAGWNPSLGLDLQGGASVVLQPDRKVSQDTLDQTIAIIRSRVDALGVAEPEIARQGDAIVVQLPGVKDTARALKIVGQTAELRFRPVLTDIQSEADIAAAAAIAASTTTLKPGTTAKPGTVSSKVVTITAPGAATTTTVGGATTTSAGAATTSAATTTAAPSVEQFAALGAGGRFGATRIAAQATTTASPPAPSTSAVPTSAAPTSVGPTSVGPSTVATAPPIDFPADISKTTSIEDDIKTKTVVLPVGERTADAPRLLLGPAELTGEIVSDAYADLDQSDGWVTILKLNGKGSAAWDAMANKYFEQRIAIVLDGVVKSAPVIQARSFGGTASISGANSSQDAKDLATALKYGALPVQLKPATVQTVSATLGRDSLRAGLLTGGLGLVLVAAYMIFFYKRLGLLVIAGLCMTASLLWIVVSYLSEQKGLALSLAGAVGIIVSVGITVDSYVVYFERLKDEMRSGKSMAGSVDRAFKGAWRTIVAADLTSFIGAMVLYLLTVGSVRGFAFFLALSTALDLVVAYFFTRPLVSILGRRGSLGGPAATGARGGSDSGGGGRLRPSGAPTSVTATAGGQS